MNRASLYTYTKQNCIVITGGIATGKSTIAQIIKTYGYPVIDADQLARQVVLPGSPGLESIKKAFGREYLEADGQLNRDLLRQTISKDFEKKKLLESILHPLIQQTFIEQVAEVRLLERKSEYFFYEAALIIEAQRQDHFKEIWLADCPYDTQVERLIKRSALSKPEAEHLIGNQLPQKAKKAFASQIINTDTSLDKLKERIHALISALEIKKTV